MGLEEDLYSKHLKLREIGKTGQERISSATVAVVGVGALGSNISTLLARAGVGGLVLIDRDIVEISNIQRQVIYNREDVGRVKVEATREHLSSINPLVEVETHAVHFDHTQTHLLKNVDIIVDGTDNVHTRYLINDYSVKEKIPWVYGGAVGTQGMTGIFIPSGPCFRCVFPNPPPPGTMPTCESMGVLNTVPAVVGALETTLALKYLVGEKTPSLLFYLNPWEMKWTEVPIAKDPRCAACDSGIFPFLDGKERPIATAFCEGDRVQIVPTKRGKNIAPYMVERYGGELRDGVAVISVEGIEMVVFDDGRAIITGTGDEKEAQAIYARYVGW